MTDLPQFDECVVEARVDGREIGFMTIDSGFTETDMYLEPEFGSPYMNDQEYLSIPLPLLKEVVIKTYDFVTKPYAAARRKVEERGTWNITCQPAPRPGFSGEVLNVLVNGSCIGFLAWSGPDIGESVPEPVLHVAPEPGCPYLTPYKGLALPTEVLLDVLEKAEKAFRPTP